jgi:nucleotide-binding universal stress UspA family protein
MIKDVLVNLSLDTDRDPARDFAISLAREFDAHLTGIALECEPSVPGTLFDGAVASITATYRAQNRKIAQSAKDRFDSATSGLMAEARIVDTGAVDAGTVFAEIARNHDLSVVGQAQPDSDVMHDLIIEGALFGSGRPVLVVPYIHRTGLKLDRVMVCWDGSHNAARAIADAMPILKRAGSIDVLTIQERKNELVGTGIAQHLARHALKVEVKQIVASDVDTPNVILSCASDLSTDLIVMGGYGHSRLREFVLGGATHGMLENMTVPTLMAH